MAYRNKEYWDNRGQDYIDKHPLSTSSNSDKIKKIIDKYNPENIVDGGCGVGRYFGAFGDRLVVGLDVVEELCKETQKRFPEKNKVILCCDLKEMDKVIAKDYYDAFFSYTALEHIDYTDIHKVVKHITSLFKIAIICEPVGFEKKAEHCFPHKYKKLFAAFGWKQVECIKIGKLVNCMIFKESKTLLIYSWGKHFAENVTRLTGIDSISFSTKTEDIPEWDSYKNIIIFPPVDYAFKRIKENMFKPKGLSGKKIYYYFLGTEVRFLETGITGKGRQYDSSVIKDTDAGVICESIEMKKRLEVLGFKDISILPLPFDFIKSDMPKEFTVGIYIKDDNVIDIQKLVDIIDRSSNIKFLIYGMKNYVLSFKEILKERKNVEYMLKGFVDIKDILPKVSCFLRLTFTDGLSVSVLEYLASGKEVIWNHKVDYCGKYVTVLDNVSKIVKKLSQMKGYYIDEPNNRMIEDMEKNYSVESFQNKLDNILE